jgi:hypothetical protein
LQEGTRSSPHIDFKFDFFVLSSAAMDKRVAPTFFMVLVALATGDDYTSCTSGSSCPGWTSLVAGPAQIVIQEEKKGEGGQYYRIDVIHADKVNYFSKLRRYSEFVSLRTTLGLGEKDTEDVAKFPPKLVFNAVAKFFNPAVMEERRAGLQEWLQKAMEDERSKGPWADALFDFLDPLQSAAVLKSGISMPVDANKICRTLTWPVTSDKHYFGIDVDKGGETPERVWRRYSDFHALNATLGELKEDDIEALGAFPEKLFWNHVVPVWEGKLEKRRRQLEAWLQKLKIHENSAPEGVWAPAVITFLDPAETEKLDKDCYFDKVGPTAYEELKKFYGNIKEKVDDLGAKMKGTGETQEGPESEESENGEESEKKEL